jgi:hypothetical protein
MTDYSKLARLAEAATPGEWQAYDTHGKRFIESMIGEAHVVCDTPKKQWLKDSEYIAAANPPAVLAMIAEIKCLKELLECAQGDCRQAMQIIEKLTPDADRYRWLRDDAVDPGTVIDKKVGVSDSEDGGYPIWEYRSGAELDSAIDAAMSKLVTKP